MKERKKVVKKNVSKKQIKIDSEYNIKKRKARNLFILMFTVVTLIFFVFLVNKTFFRNQYVSNNVKIDLPLFTYFISDKDNVLTFKTLRKSEYVKAYFDEYLSNLNNFDYYVCKNGKSFYYNSGNNVVIYDIDVSKKFALKTIKVMYDVKSNDKVCN